MKPHAILLAACCLYGFSAQGQVPESGENPAGETLRRTAGPWDIPVIAEAEAFVSALLPQAPAPSCDLLRMREEADPIRRERLRIRELMAERARQSVPGGTRTAGRQGPEKREGLWRLDIGNARDGSWSTLQDKALDARVIRYPLPRGAQADKRPETLKRLDKLKR